jgi:hypothetical protein
MTLGLLAESHQMGTRRDTRSARVKLPMIWQGLTSLIIVAVILARAINMIE